MSFLPFYFRVFTGSLGASVSISDQGHGGEGATAVEEKGRIPPLEDDRQSLEEVLDGNSFVARVPTSHSSRDVADLDDGIRLPSAQSFHR
jgi:hypothetical protein